MLLFKNSFRALLENKAKTIGVIVLIFLACLLFSLFVTSMSALESANEKYFSEQNVYHFTILPELDDSEKKAKGKDLEAIYDTKLGKLADDNGFSYELRKTALYEFEEGEDEYIFLLMVPQKEINKPYILEGRLPEKENEVTVSDQYAENNGLKIGDCFDIDDEEFTITGFAYQPDLLYPVMDEESPDVDPSMQSVVFISGKAMKELDVDIEYTFSAKFNGQEYDFNNVMALREKIKDDTKYVNARNNKINRVRTEFIHEQMKNITIFAYCFLAFLFLVITFSLTIILRKKITADRARIGQLKALGYSNFEICINYTALAVTASLTGGILGFVGGYFGSVAVIDFLTTSMLQLPVGSIGINIPVLVDSIMLPLVLFSIISYLIALSIVRRPTLELIYENRNEKISTLSKRVATLCKNRSFKTQFKFGLAANAPTRMLGIFLIMLLISLMLIVGLIVSNMVKKSVDAMVAQVSYAYEVALEDPVDISEIDTDVYYEPSISLRLYAKEGITADGQKKNYDALNHNDNAIDDYYVDTMALTADSHLLMIHDKKGDLINKKLKGDEIGISPAVSQTLGIGVGGQIVFCDSIEPDAIEKTYKVVAISDDYAQSDIYVALDTIQNDFDMIDQVETLYTAGKFVDEDLDYVAVAGIKEKEGFKQTARLTNILTISFAMILTLIAFITLLILANIIIDENRKTISMLRILGYTKKETSYMVLDFYTPIIIIAYFIALPIGLQTCTEITNIMAENTYSSYPVGISPVLFIAGGLCLYISCRFAIRRTRKNIT